MMSTGSPIDANGDLLPEQKIFGRFFKKVPECLRLMKAKNSFSTGGAVLNAFALNPNWLSTGIAFFVDDSSSESGARTAWDSYLRGEGYSFKASSDMVDGEVRSNPILDIVRRRRLVGNQLIISRSFCMNMQTVI